MHYRKRKEAGYTLIEMVLVVMLGSIMMLTVMFSAQTGMISMRATENLIQLNDQMRQAASAFAEEIAQSSPATIIAHFSINTDANGNSVVVFQVPVDADGVADWGGDPDISDTVDNATDYVQWGAHAGLGDADTSAALLGQWVRYSVQGDQLIREVLLADQATVDVANPPKVIANDILNFSVTQNLARLNVRLTAEKEDTTQGGGTPRTYTHTYATQVILRNDAY